MGFPRPRHGFGLVLGQTLCERSTGPAQYITVELKAHNITCRYCHQAIAEALAAAF